MVDKFLDYIAIEKKLSKRTVETYRDDLKEFCAFLVCNGNSIDIESVTEDDVKAWMIELIDTKKNSPRSVKQKLAALHSFYKFLLLTGIVDKDITRRVIAPKADKPLPVFFKPHEMEAATAYEDEADDNESVRDSLIIEMLYQTGMRQAEMLALKDTDIDLINKQIRIFGKRRKERIVPIGDKLIELINKYKEYRNGYYGAFFVAWKKNGVVQPLSKSGLYKIVCGRMGEVSTLKKHSPHVLRHTFATTMLNNGADIRTIQNLLGHASLAATQIYTHTTFEQIKQTYNEAHPRAVRQTEKPHKTN